jgi:hypothetical protein
MGVFRPAEKVKCDKLPTQEQYSAGLATAAGPSSGQPQVGASKYDIEAGPLTSPLSSVHRRTAVSSSSGNKSSPAFTTQLDNDVEVVSYSRHNAQEESFSSPRV